MNDFGFFFSFSSLSYFIFFGSHNIFNFHQFSLCSQFSLPFLSTLSPGSTGALGSLCFFFLICILTFSSQVLPFFPPLIFVLVFDSFRSWILMHLSVFPCLHHFPPIVLGLGENHVLILALVSPSKTPSIPSTLLQSGDRIAVLHSPMHDIIFSLVSI